MDEPVTNPGSGESEVHLLDYVIILVKHSRLIILVTAAVMIVTYLYLFCAANTYTAKAHLLPPQHNLTLSAQILDSMRGAGSPGPAGVGQGWGLSSMASSLLGLRSPGDMFAAMMKSDTVLDHIITRFELKKLYGRRYLEDTRRDLLKNTSIIANKTDYIISVEVTSKTPQLAAAIANAFIEELDRLLQGLALQEAKGRLEFLEKERALSSQKLIKAEESLRRFSEKNSVLQIDTQTKGAIEYVARLRAEIDTKEVGIQVLRQQATPLNYDVVRLETEIKGLKEKLRNAEHQLDNCTSDVCLPTGKAPGLGLEYFRLFREVKFQENLYQLFTKLVEVARIDMVRDVATVQVLDPAMPPERKSNKRFPPAMMAAMITFFLMSLVAFGWEHLQSATIREDDIRRLALLKEYLQSWRDIMIKMINYIGFKRRL